MADTSQPGDTLLDRYIPTASLSVREETRDNLRRLARLLIRVHRRLTSDNPQPVTRATADSALESESPQTSV